MVETAGSNVNRNAANGNDSLHLGWGERNRWMRRESAVDVDQERPLDTGTGYGTWDDLAV
jgi:hypothetical protein